MTPRSGGDDQTGLVASDWLTLKAASDYIGVGERRVAKLASDGTVTAKGSGVAMRVSRSALDAYVAKTPAVRATRDRIEQLGAEGLSIEVIARTTGATRYRVERILGRGPASRSGVPYRYRKVKEENDIAGRYRGGESAEDIAHDLGVSVTLVFEELKRLKVALRGRVEPWVASYEDVLTEEYLRRTYVEERRGTWEIAAEVGCSEATVRNWVRRYQIAPRPSSERRRAYKYPPELLQRVASGDLTVEAASEQVGCSRTELSRALRRAGLNLRVRPQLSRDYLTEQYLVQSKSCPQIAAETGWSTQTVRSRLAELEIPRRRGVQRRHQ